MWNWGYMYIYSNWAAEAYASTLHIVADVYVHTDIHICMVSDTNMADNTQSPLSSGLMPYAHWIWAVQLEGSGCGYKHQQLLKL